MALSVVRPFLSSHALVSFDVARYSVWLSFTISGSITQLVKVTVGRPRPSKFTVLGWVILLLTCAHPDRPHLALPALGRF